MRRECPTPSTPTASRWSAARSPPSYAAGSWSLPRRAKTGITAVEGTGMAKKSVKIGAVKGQTAAQAARLKRLHAGNLRVRPAPTAEEIATIPALAKLKAAAKAEPVRMPSFTMPSTIRDDA